MQAQRTSKNRKTAFTLIELMVVISIIGVFFSFMGRRNTLVLERSRDAAIMVEIGHLRNAVHQFSLAHGGRFPETLEDLVPEFISRKTDSWSGARSKGKYHYEPETGRISLFNTSDSVPDSTPDSKGRPYAEY